MVMTFTGHRSAQSPQRIQRVSSLSMAAPVMTPKFLGRYVVQLHMEDPGLRLNLVQHVRRKLDPVERYKSECNSPGTHPRSRRTECTAIHPAHCPRRPY